LKSANTTARATKRVRPAKARAKPGPEKRTRAAAARTSALDALRLLHELEVHQVELQSQNEELCATRLELEAALEGYTELFDFAPIGYATLDARDSIRNVNFAGARVFDTPRGHLVGKPFAALITTDDVAGVEALLAEVRVASESRSAEVRARCGERGRPVMLRLTANVQPRIPGGLLLAFEDVSQRKAEQQRLANADRAMRESSQRKDDFLAMLSHELRNPLTPIRTSLFVIGRSDPASAESVHAHAIIERQVTHLTRLVDDLLDVTRISRGKVRLHRERVDLAELVRRTADDHRADFDAHNVELMVAASPGRLWADVDAARIVQAVTNLLGNACKFTPPGGRVELALQRRHASAELRVRDSGIGISSELLPHVFESFTQAPQTLDRPTGGLGLGLAMVKGFIELHGGSVRMTSDGVGRGVEVAITLPLASAAPRTPAPARLALASRRVLVIEDHADTANGLHAALTMLGLDVRIAVNGASGIELARTFRPAVLLCDIGLPGMSGLDIARTFRGDHALRDTYLVAYSGYTQPEDIHRAKAAGFSRHLSKPATLEALVQVIAEAP
jgi:two-component system CheB/CheR fusion protein